MVSVGSGVSKEPGVPPASQVGSVVSLLNIGTMYQTTQCHKPAKRIVALRFANIKPSTRRACLFICCYVQLEQV